jgi:hypothetical protein
MSHLGENFSVAVELVGHFYYYLCKTEENIIVNKKYEKKCVTINSRIKLEFVVKLLGIHI